MRMWKKIDSPSKGGSCPSGDDFKDDAEVGGGRGGGEEEKACQRSEHEPSTHRA